MAKRRQLKRGREWEERRKKRREFVLEERGRNVMAQCFKMLGRERTAQDFATTALSEMEKSEPNMVTIRNAEILLKEVVADRHNLIKAIKKQARSAIRAGRIRGSLDEHLKDLKRSEKDHKEAIERYNKLLQEIEAKKKARGLEE